MEALYILGFVACAQTALIYGLINRLLAANGHRALRPLARIGGAIDSLQSKPDVEKIEREPGKKVGSLKVRL